MEQGRNGRHRLRPGKRSETGGKAPEPGAILRPLGSKCHRKGPAYQLRIVRAYSSVSGPECQGPPEVGRIQGMNAQGLEPIGIAGGQVSPQG